MHETMSNTRPSRTQPSADHEWIEQVRTLQRALEVCPADLTARKTLATLLEELQEWDGALFNWRRVLAYDPNHLEAWEGLARCRKALHDLGFPPHHPGADRVNM
ncbi:MAG TPA: tetratricopeptide repeat protein [Nitrospiraceae bacterium]|nr:tetratricopeptide repeat protein [Nitrospiraceae bacterium]